MSNTFTLKTLKTHLTSGLTLILQIYIYKPGNFIVISKGSLKSDLFHLQT